MSTGGGGGPSQQTVTQTNLPEYAEPYFKELLGLTQGTLLTTDAEGNPIFRPYEAYDQPRIAGLADQPDIMAAYDITRDVATSPIPGLGAAADVAAGNIAAGQAIADAAQPAQFRAAQFSQFEPTEFADFKETQVQGYDYDPTRQFTGSEVGQYMSPYMQHVLARQAAEARRQFEIGGASRAAQAVQAGAFGGSRQAVQEAMAEEALQRQMGDIYAGGMQSAFESAQQAFQADRAAQFARERAQVEEIARTQGISVQEAARVQQSRAAEAARVQGIQQQELARVEAARAGEMARVQAAQAAENRAARQEQLQALGFSAEQAAQLAGYGETARAADIQGAQLLETIGRTQQSEEQMRLDTAYQDFLRQQGFPESQLQLYSSILRGVPIEPTTTQTAYAPYNPAQQILGAGLTGVGLYQGLR